MFLNKIDEFSEKIQTNSLANCFKEYDKGKELFDGVDYIKSQFLKQNKDSDVSIYVQVANTNTKNGVKKVWYEMYDIIYQFIGLRENLKQTA